MKKIKAVYTIEAAVIFPTLLFLTAGGVQLSIHMFTQVKEASANYEKVTDLDGFDTVKKIQTIAKIAGYGT